VNSGLSICKHETSRDIIVHSGVPRSLLPFQYLQWFALVGFFFTLLDDWSRCIQEML